jgi:hypothetical protein
VTLTAVSRRSQVARLPSQVRKPIKGSHQAEWPKANCIRSEK